MAEKKRWTEAEDEILATLYNDGKPLKAMVKRLKGRTLPSVRMRLHKLREQEKIGDPRHGGGPGRGRKRRKKDVSKAEAASTRSHGRRSNPRTRDAKRPQGFEWSKQNGKMMKTQRALRQRGEDATLVGFSLPQLRSVTGKTTCPYAGSCADLCYASMGFYKFSHVRKKYEHNLARVLEHKRNADNLADDLYADLVRMRSVTHVRLHDSGDFFSPTYYRAWLQVVEALPDIVFYGYTKSLPLLDWKLHPSNLRLVQSEGGKRDDMIVRRRPHSRIFADHADRVIEGYVDGSDSDIHVLDDVVKIGLVYHGDRPLSTDAIIQLRRPGFKRKDTK